MIYREATIKDLNQLKDLALKSWIQFEEELSLENWGKLKINLSNNSTYESLLEKSYSLVCVSDTDKIIGMSFLVPSGNPTEIYDESWSYIRLVTVDPSYGGKGIGKQLTERCIEYAKQNGEKIIALHTSEMMHKARHIYENLGFTILKELAPRFEKKYWLYTRYL
jgi:ribosomal protein S18 acetylase RimI-like enzyme